MMKQCVNDGFEIMLFLNQTESPDLIRAFNDLQLRGTEKDYPTGNSLFPLSGKTKARGNFFQKLPEWMLEVAELMDKNLERPPKRKSQSSYWGYIAWVVERVKSKTGREHYDEVSELLDFLLDAKH